jgi:tRNA U34 2-thiouridine synthase MnmA/TrmU
VEEKKKVVALLSGGLDSRLAVKMMQNKGFDVTAVAIKTPFCDFDCGRGCGFEIRETADTLGVDLKTVYLGDEYIEMLKNPKYGYGSGMNPCIDCRAMMFKAGKKVMEDIGAEFIISGEVLGQRPMSQHAPALRTIEKESGLEGKIVRPLSGALLQQTEPEVRGLIKREDLGKIHGRSRKEQIKLAQQFGFENPPNAGGGCLLTDPRFAIRAKDLFRHTETPTINDIDLLKIGRHFRFDTKTKLIVGRNMKENEMLKTLALRDDVLLETKDYVGPISLLRGLDSVNNLKLAAAITFRYSDAPTDLSVVVISQKNDISSEISTQYIAESEYLKYRI